MGKKLTYEELELKVKKLDTKTKKLKQIEKTLKEKITELNSFINNVPDMAWIKDIESRFIAVNKTFSETVGMNPESLINQSCEVCFGKEAAKKFREDDQEVMKGKKQVTIVEKIKDSKKNEEIWLETIKSPIFNESGRVSGTVGIARDITHHKLTQEELVKSKAMFEAVIESLPFDVFALDRNSRYILQNSICKKNWGDLIGKSPEAIAVDKHTKRLWLENNRLAFSGETVKGEVLYDRLSGEKIYYYNVITPIRDEEKIYGILGVLVDISELKQAEETLKQSEERFRRLVETMNDGLGIQDEKGIITYVNSKFGHMLGYKPENLIGKSVTDFLDDRNKQIFKNEIAIRIKGKVSSYEIEWVCKDGKKIPTIMSPQAIFDEKGQFKGSFSVITDISSFKQVEEALRQSKERFRNLTETTSDWVWEVDKDLRYTYVSPKIRDIIGHFPEEIMGKTIFDLMPPEEAHRVSKIFNTITESKQPFYCLENINLHKKGHPVVLETSGIPILDDDGELCGYRGIDRDITKRKRTEEFLRKQTFDLDERVKELNCLYGISKIRERPDITFEEMLQEIVDLIPSSWHYPEIVCARIIIEGQEYKTKNFKEKVWNQTSDIVVHGKRIGILEICYPEERPESDEEPFLKEERSLISAITERLGRITEHKRADGALRKAHDELEKRVEKRTKDLEIQKSNLEEANIAMQVLLDKRQEDKKELEDNVLTNVKEMIVPYFEKIKKTKLDDQQKAVLNIVESCLNEIISPFTRKMSLKYLNLTPTEIQVANLIRYGSNSKEIADILGLSPRTIYNHRKNIRKKFGLKNKKTNLRSHLLSTH